MNTIIAGSGLCWLFPAPAMVSRTQGLPPGPARGAGAVRKRAEVLSPSLISPSSCITAAKFRRFTRNYHQQPPAPGLSEQVNDLSPGLCPRVTAITAGSASSQRSLPPHRDTLFTQTPTPKRHTWNPSSPTPRALCPPPAAGQPPRRARPPHPRPGLISQAWGIGKTPSIPPPPRRELRAWQGGRGLAGNRERRCRGLPDKPRQPRHEAPALFPKRFRS